jgi:hypothetical protein
LQRIINTPRKSESHDDRASMHAARNRMSLFDAIRNVDQIAGLSAP